MPIKEKYDFKDLWDKAQAIIDSGGVHTISDLAEIFGIKRTTLREGFVRLVGNDAVRGMFQKKNQDAANHVREFAEAEYEDNYINIVCSSRRITTVAAAIQHFKIDLSQWRVDRFRVKTSEGYRKDRQVEWVVEDGKTKKGKVIDSGKMLVVPMFHISVSLVRKVDEIRAGMVVRDLIKDAARHAPKYKPVKYKKFKRGLRLEVDIPDIHFGKETWAEESGADYDIHIARNVVLKTLEKLLIYADGFEVEKIIFPMGNDFFNVDGKENTTTHGTPQQEDTRWNRTFREGRRLAVDMIDRCLQVAPVDVVMVPGNHDEERSFYLGEVLHGWYRLNKNVNVDIEAKKRKYYDFGKVLLGFTHGYYEKVDKLPAIMPLEEPEKWARSKHREFHLGDKHHKKDLLPRTEDREGVTIRLLRSLSPADAWHFDKGFIGAPRSAEAFLWDGENGLVAQFQARLME